MKTQFSKPAMLVILIAATACSTASAELKLKLPRAPWKKKDEIKRSAYDRPVRMVVIWTPDVLTVPGRTPTRGFGGRLYFYNNQNKPVAVDGQLIVYAYDQGKQENADTATPNRAYAFKPEDFASKYSESTIGASYNVWVPWDAQGSAQSKVQLIPIFTSANGHRVLAEPSEVILPGKQAKSAPKEHLGEATREVAEEQEQLPPQVAPVAYHPGEPTRARAEYEAQRRRLRTTTIELPSRTARQLRTEPLPTSSLLPANGQPASGTAPINQGASMMARPVVDRFGGAQMSEANRNAAFPGRNVQVPGQLAQASAMPGPMNHGYGQGASVSHHPAQVGNVNSAPFQLPAQAHAPSRSMNVGPGSTTQRLRQAASNARTWPTAEQRQARFAPNQYQAPTAPSAAATAYRGPSAPHHAAPGRLGPSTGHSLFPAQ